MPHAQRRRQRRLVDHLRGRRRPRCADFTETRLQGADSGAAPLGAGLPLIGQPAGRRAAAHPARAARPRPGRPDRPGAVLVASPAQPRLDPGRRHRPGADAVAAARQVGVAGADRQRRGVPGGAGERRGAGRATCAACSNGEGDVAGRAGERAGRARAAAAAGRPRREERQHRARPAEDADPGRPGAARDQPPVVRPARDRRDGVVAEAAAGRHRRPSCRRSASW